MHKQNYGKPGQTPGLNPWDTTDTSEYAPEQVQYIKLLI